jgi:hypothetical protein
MVRRGRRRLKGSKRKVDRPRTSVPDTASNPLGVRTDPRGAARSHPRDRRQSFRGKGVRGVLRRRDRPRVGDHQSSCLRLLGKQGGTARRDTGPRLALLREKLDRLDEEYSPYETRSEVTVAAYIDAVLENKSFVSVLLRDFVSSERTRERQRAFRHQCREMLEREIAAGNIRAFDPEVHTSWPS